MQVYKYPQKQDWTNILQRPVLEYEKLKDTVSEIIKDIREKGDKAVKKYTKKFDKVECDNLLVQSEEILEAEKAIKPQLKSAIELAKKNIYKFHYAQREELNYIQTISGVECWRRSVPIQRVGLYIPGGTAPLFSSVLMLGVPAKIAGCEEIVLCTPPNEQGKIHPAILYAAKSAGIHQIYKVGGVQAIAAMAYSTQTIPKTYKIFGPGNQYVTVAKQLVSLDGVAIDMPAGPSEVLVLADSSTEPEFIASDLLSQAEHGIDSQVILLTIDEKLIDKVLNEVEKQLSVLPRKELTAKSLENSKAIVVKDQVEAVELINEYAPEHLIISVNNEGFYIDRIKNAGSVFLGKYTPEAAGDYASGTNHTLPTNGYAKAYSGVSLDSFVKKITFQRITRDALMTIGPSIEILADAEQLTAHKNAVTVRMKKIYEDRMKDKYDDKE